MTNNSATSDTLKELAQLAANLGPILFPSEQREYLCSIAATARRVLHGAACSILVLDEHRDELVFEVVSGGAGDRMVGLRLPVGQGIAGWVASSGQPLAIEQVAEDPRFARAVADTVGYLPRSILAMPLETERRVLGVIEVLDRRGSPDDMELLGLFARQAVLAIQSATVFAELGRALFEAAGGMVDGGLAESLRRAAESGSPPAAELAQLAACLAEVGRLGEAERAVAARIVDEFLRYARRGLSGR